MEPLKEWPSWILPPITIQRLPWQVPVPGNFRKSFTKIYFLLNML